MTPWEIHAVEVMNCNCAYGCPCQFNALPTYGTCEAAVGFQIEKGFYGDVSLDGLTAGMMAKWPGPIHEGNGERLLIIDDQASSEQRDALEKNPFRRGHGRDGYHRLGHQCHDHHPP